MVRSTRLQTLLRRARLRPLLTLAYAAVALAPSLRAHGNDQLVIDALTEEIAQAPAAELFLRRGELYRHQEQWVKAEADYVSAEKLDPSLTIVSYFLARVHLDAGAPAKAAPIAERYSRSAPAEPEGWFLRAEIAHALGETDAAAAHAAEGIRRSANPRAEHYLRRARILATARPAAPERVLAAIDEGIARLGHALPLVDYAVTLETEAGRYDQALARIDAAMENLPRRERWLARRGDILAKTGRITEAISAYRAALEAIAALPERFRATVPMEKLATDARLALARLGAER
jgi:predicted Zn-dependent protease